MPVAVTKFIGSYNPVPPDLLVQRDRQAVPAKFEAKFKKERVKEGRPRLLVVDSDKQIQRTVSDSLEGDSFEVVFEDSLEKLEQLLLANSSFNAVLIDFYRPVDKFFDFLSRIKEVCPKTEVIFTSWLKEEDLWIESIQRGAYDYLPKPLDRQELQRIVTNAVERNRFQ
jgi:DNA-binding NtrC family response regulator